MQSIIPIMVINSQNSSVIYLKTNINDRSTFIFNDTKQIVNNSFCAISNLEVYRGRKQAIEISHKGFLLSGNGSIEVETILSKYINYYHDRF